MASLADQFQNEFEKAWFEWSEGIYYGRCLRTLISKGISEKLAEEILENAFFSGWIHHTIRSTGPDSGFD